MLSLHCQLSTYVLCILIFGKHEYIVHSSRGNGVIFTVQCICYSKVVVTEMVQVGDMVTTDH